ncbi:hypothetical protein BKA70DRAFT_1532823 [Coprinopsis sp. MPI-PUGE-AT-0042]|nr:hypothetical protein BKA70DRAFT_1532823 [Coprinopsis sp. MPI-PUGE-AT-0042]
MAGTRNVGQVTVVAFGCMNGISASECVWVVKGDIGRRRSIQEMKKSKEDRGFASSDDGGTEESVAGPHLRTARPKTPTPKYTKRFEGGRGGKKKEKATDAHLRFPTTDQPTQNPPNLALWSLPIQLQIRWDNIDLDDGGGANSNQGRSPVQGLFRLLFHNNVFSASRFVMNLFEIGRCAGVLLVWGRGGVTTLVGRACFRIWCSEFCVVVGGVRGLSLMMTGKTIMKRRLERGRKKKK